MSHSELVSLRISYSAGASRIPSGPKKPLSVYNLQSTVLACVFIPRKIDLPEASLADPTHDLDTAVLHLIIHALELRFIGCSGLSVLRATVGVLSRSCGSLVRSKHRKLGRRARRDVRARRRGKERERIEEDTSVA